MKCEACDDRLSREFFHAPSVPVACNVLYPTREAALDARRGEIALALCTGCGLVYNRAFDEALLSYTGTYENALHFSPQFRAYARDLAQGLIDRYDLRGKRVVELGCGDGSFLSLLVELGVAEGIGFDPAHDPARSAIPQGAPVRIERALYGPGTAPPRADLVVCRHTLEHVPRPLEFLRALRRAIGDAQTPVFFEVPGFAYTLEHGGIWDVVYEHCLYFTGFSLRRVFERAGFCAATTGAAYGEQFLTIGARPDAAAVPGERPMAGALMGGASMQDEGDTQRLADLAAAFGEMYGRKVARWRQTLADLRRSGRRAALWGAGTKGVMFLNTMGPDAEAVACVVDVNPRKHGCFIAGAGQRIIGPHDLPAIAPDAVIVMNPQYRPEISEQLASLGIGGPAGAEVMVA